MFAHLALTHICFRHSRKIILYSMHFLASSVGLPFLPCLLCFGPCDIEGRCRNRTEDRYLGTVECKFDNIGLTASVNVLSCARASVNELSCAKVSVSELSCAHAAR